MGASWSSATRCEVTVEVAVPDPFPGIAGANLVIRGAGQEERVDILVTRKATPAPLDPAIPDDEPGGAAVPGPIAAFLALSTGKQVAIAALLGLTARLLVGVAGGSIGEDAMTPTGPDAPHLGGVVLAFAAVGAGLVGWFMARRSSRGDAGAGAIAGAGLGALLAAATVALCRAIEPMLGSRAASPLVVCAVWAVLGGGIGWLTSLIPRSTVPEAAS